MKPGFIYYSSNHPCKVQGWIPFPFLSFLSWHISMPSNLRRNWCCSYLWSDGERRCVPGESSGQKAISAKQRTKGALKDPPEWLRRLRPSGLHTPFPTDHAYTGIPAPDSLLNGARVVILTSCLRVWGHASGAFLLGSSSICSLTNKYRGHHPSNCSKDES